MTVVAAIQSKNICAPSDQTAPAGVSTGKTVWSRQSTDARCELLGTMATTALIAEAILTPKPALVDRRGQGAHTDLTLASMLKSALTLEIYFQEMAQIASAAVPSQTLREELAECGRRAEVAMHDATGGSNSHRGAIWCLGLLVAGASLLNALPGVNKTSIRDTRNKPTALHIAQTAGAIAAFNDRMSPELETHGRLMHRKYGAGGARVEAQSGFPHVINLGLPHLQNKRLSGAPESACRLDALLSIMSKLDDTCLLYRGGTAALQVAQTGASQVLAAGGTNNAAGMSRFYDLERELLQSSASPGGSADLLAATLFLDSLTVS